MFVVALFTRAMGEINLNALTHEWARQMCYIYLTIRIIIVGKMKACKRMELAKIILKVTQDKRDKVRMFSLIWLSSSSFVLCI